jgi:hypothetical protein
MRTILVAGLLVLAGCGDETVNLSEACATADGNVRALALFSSSCGGNESDCDSSIADGQITISGTASTARPALKNGCSDPTYATFECGLDALALEDGDDVFVNDWAAGTVADLPSCEDRLLTDP